MAQLHWTHDAVKAKDYDGRELLGGVWYAHAKLDGHRLTFFAQQDGSVVAYGRERYSWLEMTHRFPCVKAVADALAERRCLPTMSSLDCEVWSPGSKASKVPTALRGGLPVAFAAFGVPYWCGASMADATMDWAEIVFRGFDLPESLVSWAPMYRVPEGPFDRDAWQRRATAEGHEGWVLKRRNGCDWWKIKGVKTLDAIVLDTKPGKGKFAGLVGSLVVGVLRSDGSLREIADVGGMDDEMRRAMTELDAVDQAEGLPTSWTGLPDRLLRPVQEAQASTERLRGRAVEVEYQYVGDGPNGRLRHPRFVRFRDDKPIKECTDDQLA